MYSVIYMYMCVLRLYMTYLKIMCVKKKTKLI